MAAGQAQLAEEGVLKQGIGAVRITRLASGTLFASCVDDNVPCVLLHAPPALFIAILLHIADANSN